MTHDFLLEMGLEELPANVVTASVDQLAQKVTNYLKAERLTFTGLKKFSTPRRLALQISGLADRQPDSDTEVKGPSEKIARTDNGWSKAALGFAHSQGIQPDDLVIKEVKGVAYVFANKHVTGQPAVTILSQLPNVIASLNFPTMMRWGTHQFQFVRPIKWLVALLDTEIVPMQLVDIQAGRTTQGHRFLGHPVELKQAQDYQAALEEVFVLADAQQRKQRIKDQIMAIAREQGWQVNLDAQLLEEVNNLVEWPTSFYGQFDRHFLTIPREVLITSMRNHQRFFYVEDEKNQLLPYFISVRNGNRDHLENVIQGNEKVLAARLYDAAFFYEEDQKHSIADFVTKLKEVSFHDQISTMYEKMERVQVITALIGKQVGLSQPELAELQRAASIYKFDLVTEMVGEFSELQGIMGEKYALLQGESPAVATAIREHYLPNVAGGALPATKIGAVLAVADKLDSILTFFAAKMVPSGSNDPYALRRQAAGIVSIVYQQQWQLPLDVLLNEVVQTEARKQFSPKVEQAPVIPQVISFIKERIKRFLKDTEVRYDLVNAATASTSTDICFMISSANELQKQQNKADFKANIEALSRVTRIASKQAGSFATIDPLLFENEAEVALHGAVDQLQNDFSQKSAASDYQQLANLRPVINDYFEKTMIMAENQNLKANRLAEMNRLAKIINEFASVDHIMTK
ncbi:Glycyl-tRNA synthetase beta chain [Fructilactobacillus florum 8D]|uniref:Glycine--tRNA ligase beta subunit n=1 Tax=Fructilactobacillus florum 8D TaxID=1221538 RepID=W9EFG0_9LACO|nr:glycine--tRNA ligase subunit beta [Fructilactobacillus florum]EKK20188.1 Glycyl-tRNA synthetase beta chain [Fructilactobacillus florum 2F]ETO40873.1 Glycyl-tRNA synthetase beta chain [Fructilactobacillus florum 8D]